MLHWKSLTPERKHKLFQFCKQKRKCVFTKFLLCFSFSFSFISVLLQSQATVAHLLPADFPYACWQGLHHLGSEWCRRVTSGASAPCFSLLWLPSSSHDLLQMLSRLWGVEVMVFPVPICCALLLHTKRTDLKQQYFVLSLLTILPACGQAAFLPISFIASQLILPPTAL